MTFSFSAPVITPEDEALERENLTEEERQCVHDDLHGSNPGIDVVQESEDIRNKGLSEMKHAMALIPPEEKLAYLEALERCPDLVEKESNPLFFLRADDYHVEAAVHRLIEYWKLRRKIFRELAFQPMTQTGAMSNELETLQERLITIMPGTDDAGRTVVHCHRSRFSQEVAPRKTLLKVLFYIFQCTLQCESTTRAGLVIIFNLKRFSIYHHFDRVITKTIGQIISTCFPFKLRAAHVCFASSGKSIGDLIFPVVKHILGKMVRLRLVFHAGSDQDLIRGLESYGMHSKQLPTEVGGSISSTDCIDWIKEQFEDEANKTLKTKTETTSTTADGCEISKWRKPVLNIKAKAA